MCHDDPEPEASPLKKHPHNQSYLTNEQVPPEFRESFITYGYRPANRPALYYITSVLHLNNETFNFWSHFIPFLVTLGHLSYSLLASIRSLSADNAPFYVYELTIALYLLGSSLAHMFNSMSSTVRHMCFILDYLGISIYGMGSAISYEAYAMVEADTSAAEWLFVYYLWLASFLTSLANIVTCYSRFVVRKGPRVLVRMGSFVLQYSFVHIPLYYRFGVRLRTCIHEMVYN